MATIDKENTKKDPVFALESACKKQFKHGYDTTDKFIIRYDFERDMDGFALDLDLWLELYYSDELATINLICEQFLTIDSDAGFIMTNLNNVTYSIRVFPKALPPLVIKIIAKVDTELLTFTFSSIDKAQIAKMKSDYTFDFRSMKGIEFSDTIVKILSDYIIRPGQWTYKDPA